MTALRKSVLKTDNPRETKASELVISIAEQVIEHAIGEKIKCEHCRDLLQHLKQHFCERCGKETDRLQLNSRYGSDFQLCAFCMEHD
jgi:rRNA maturation endonuclease Nob1